MLSKNIVHFGQLIGLAMTGLVHAQSNIDIIVRAKADHQALLSAQNDYQQRLTQGQLSAAENNDYQVYLKRLKNQFRLDCLALVASEPEQIPPELPCPTQTSNQPTPAMIDQAAEQTTREQIAVLDQELNATLGAFDEMLLRQQERVKKAALPPDDALSAGGGASEAQSDDAQAGESAQAYADDVASNTAEGEPSDDGEISDEAGSTGNEQATTKYEQPDDIPDGSDDDVVARQLREAAENEADPVLREKLWQEYRQYKQGTR